MNSDFKLPFSYLSVQDILNKYLLNQIQGDSKLLLSVELVLIGYHK